MTNVLESLQMINGVIDRLYLFFCDYPVERYETLSLTLHILYRVKKGIPFLKESDIDIYDEYQVGETIVKPRFMPRLDENRRKKVYEFVCDVYSELSGIPQEIYRDNYVSIIDSLLIKYCDIINNEYAQPKELTLLVNCLVNQLGCKSMYNPFAGIGSFAIGFDGSYYGQEPCCDTHSDGIVNLDAHGIQTSSYCVSNSITDWDDHQADCIVSVPPFDSKFYSLYLKEMNYKNVDEFIVAKVIESHAKYAFLVLPRNFCYKGGRYYELRKDLIDHNLVDMVINLPEGLFCNTNVATSLIVINKERQSVESVRLVDAEKLCSHVGKILMLDYKAIIRSINEKAPSVINSVNRSIFYDYDYIFDSSCYALQNIELEEGQEKVTLSALLTPSSGSRISLPDNDYHNILHSSNYVEDLFHLQDASNKEIANQPFYEFRGRHLAINMQGRVYVHQNSKTCFGVYSALRNFVFTVDETRIDLDYLAYKLLTNDIIQRYYYGLKYARFNNSLFLKYQLVIDSSIDKQRLIVKNLREEYAQQELHRLGIRNISAEISHMLGVPKDAIGDTLYVLLNSKDLSEDDRSLVKTLSDNFEYMRRIIDYNGDDFIQASKRNEDIQIVPFLNDYLDSWKNIGYANTYSIDKSFDLDESITINWNPDLLQIMLDAALKNAYKHGFEKQSSSNNRVLVGCKAVDYIGEAFICLTIANNGKSLPKEFTINDFITRGMYGKETGNTGIGGYHIYTIIKKYGGYLRISSNSQWNFILDILLPFDNYSNLNLVDYGSKCI